MEMNIFWRRFAVVFLCLSGNVCVYAGWFDGFLSSINEKENTNKDCNGIFDFENCEKDTTTNKVTTKKVTEAIFLQNITRSHARMESNTGPNSTPSLFVKPKAQTAKQDQEVVIQCRDEGNTRLEVFWSRLDYRPLPENAIDQNGRLTISNIKCEDGGDYVCRPVKNKYKNHASISTVKVICRTSPTTTDTALEPYTPSPFKQIQTLPCQNFTLNGTCCHVVCESCGPTCKADEFRCSNGDCIENERFCDGKIDCPDGSDEKSCSSSWLPKIIMLPKMNVELTCFDSQMLVPYGSTLELQCAFVGYPVPTIKWKKYEGHVPSKCLQSSLNGHGTLKCPDFQQSDQGAYSCVAENSKGSSESQPKSIVKCSNVFFCDGFKVVDEHNIETCLECFCHGKTEECEGIKSVMVKNEMQFPEETEKVFIEPSGEVFFVPYQSSASITYCSMPKEILASYSFLKSYGRNLNVPRYNDKSDFLINAPDVIIGNGKFILKYSFNKISHGSPTSDIRFWAGVWHHNNGTVASRRDIMRVLSNVDLLMFRCEYKKGNKLNLSDAIVTLESSKIADSSSVSYMEKCSCPKAYDGLSCEKCSPGYRRKSDGVDFVCEEDSPQKPCDEGYVGEKCDQCDATKAYYMNSKGQCVKSLCNMKGSISSFPNENDECICKENVAGDYCDSCKQGSFHLDEANPHGCKKCWCNNVSDKCTSSEWYKTEISSTSLGGYNASSGRNFWLLPSEFSGNRLTSYGGFLTYSMKYLPNIEKQPKTLSVEILSNDDTTLKYLDLNLDHSKSGTEKTWNVPIEEPHWRDTKDKAVSREQLLKVLSNVKAIYIESPYHLNSGEVNLIMVQLDVAEEISNEFNLLLGARAEKVEQCSCPDGYKGLSCESCSDGYYKKKIRNSFECVKCDCDYCDPEYGCRDCKKGEYNDNSNSSELPICLKCPCNGNEEYCYKDVYGQVMCICKINYSGITCQYKEITSPSHLNVKISPIKVKNKKAGSVVTFNCSYDSTEDMQIVFKKTYKVSTDKIKTPDSGLEIVHSTINMFDTISSANITIDLNLEFVECLVYNMNRVKVGHVFAIIEGTVTDFVKPVIENCYDEPKHVKEMEDLDLICEARGTPEPEIQWYLKSDNSMQEVDTVNGVHSLTSADLQQNGTIYFCIATNSVGDDKCSTHIIVQKRCDVISAKPEHAEVYVGENVHFVCSTTNNSTVTWSRVGFFMPPAAQVNGGALDIEKVQESDAGDYLCEADTRDGHLSKTVTLSVNVKSEPPTAVILEEDLILTSGTYYEIDCIGTGNPKPVIHWRKILDRLPLNTFVSGNRLIISSATAENAGVYECTAASLLGNATSRISVKVIAQPQIRIEPHSINRVVEGESLSLRCVVEKGIPAPTISWSSIDKLFLNVQDDTLWFKKAEIDDAGRYICQADNEVGSAIAEAEVVVVTPPTVELKPRGSLHAYIDDYVVVTCEARGFPTPEIIWKQKTVSQVIGGAEPNVKVLPKYDKKVSIRVTSDLHSIICKAVNEVGEVSESLLILPKSRGWTSPGPKSESIRAELGEKIDLIFDGISGVIECRKDNASLPGDVCYTSNGLEISSVQVHHRGTYRCQSKSDPLQEKSLVLAVTGFIHKFSEYLRSYLLLPLTVQSKEFRLEITFKADRPSGLILLSKRNHEFVMYLTRNSTVKVKLHHFQKVLVLESTHNLKLHVWYTVVFKAGLTAELIIYDEYGKTIETQSSALNFQINWNSNNSNEIYVGGVSNKRRLTFPSLTARLPSFDGCISRLIIDDHEYRMTEEGKYSKDVSLCKVCSSIQDPCLHKGVCFDAPTQYGFVCVCDENDWMCPTSCRGQGCQMKNDLCKMINPCMNPENKCVHNQNRLSCRCAPGFSGLTCEKEEKFDFRLDGNGFVKLPPSYLPRYSFYRPETIAIKFTLSDLNGLLLWQGDAKNYLYLIVENGMLEYMYYNQRKILTVKTNYDTSLSLNKTHYVEITRMNGTVTMNLDGYIYEGKSVFTTNRVHGDIFIGGIPEDKKYDWSIGSKLIYGAYGFRGCIHFVAIGDVQKSINIMEKRIVRQNIRKCDLINIAQSYDIISGDLQSESEEDSAESDDDQIEY